MKELKEENKTVYFFGMLIFMVALMGLILVAVSQVAKGEKLKKEFHEAKKKANYYYIGE